MKNILVLLICLMSFGLSAQKFGYINSQELIQAIPAVKEANSNIETYKTQLQKKGQELLKSLQAKYQDLERKQAQGEISPKQLELEAQDLKKDELSIGKFEQESQQQILEKTESLLKPIREKIQTAINDVASENGYNYIFDYGMGILVYADKSTDVSQLVKAKLGL